MKQEVSSLSASYITLGCKVNQYETEQARKALEALGLATVPSGAPAKVVIINTCSVTNTADSKSRSAIRKAARANPGALIVVTGCYSQLEPLDTAAIEGVDMVVTNEQKSELAELIAARLGISSEITEIKTVEHRLRTRAVVKVQDGCDNYCAYCVIPYARPYMQSRPLVEVLDEIRLLIEAGFQEIVLTGIRLGSYFDQGAGIADLVRRCANLDGIGRIRLSSIEPWEVSDALLDAMQSSRVCKHLHVPLQSGDDDILRAMNRHYSSGQYLELLEKIRSRLPGIGITTDIIAGFPGESSGNFENSLQVVRKANFARMHVFRYSARSRTLAEQMPGQLPAQIKQQRAQQLEALGGKQRIEFARSWIGSVLPVLLERRSETSGYCRGYTDNYIEVQVSNAEKIGNKIVNVRLTDVLEDAAVIGSLSD